MDEGFSRILLGDPCFRMGIDFWVVKTVYSLSSETELWNGSIEKYKDK